ncbi:hypothetical protein [Pseudomonas sp. RT6P73]
MTAEVNFLAAPKLREAIDGKLYVHNLIDPAHGEIEAYPNAAKGDFVKLTVATSTGNTWSEEVLLNSLSAGKLIVFKIPKRIFEENLTSGATAELQYTVERPNQVPEFSTKQEVKLEL